MSAGRDAHRLTKYLHITHKTHSSVTVAVSKKNPRIHPKTIHPRKERGSAVTMFQP